MRLALPAASEAELSCCQPDQMWQAVTASFWASSPAFGGPVVHFQIFHRKFVQGLNPWLDELTVSTTLLHRS
jgi:hypothetical protein